MVSNILENVLVKSDKRSDPKTWKTYRDEINLLHMLYLYFIIIFPTRKRHFHFVS